MEPQDVREQFRNLTVWSRGSQRAPHKPLLVLLALGRLLNDEAGLTPYAWIDEKLRDLLREFGPPRRSVHPEYPFWRLQNDGIWQLVGAESVERRASNSDARKSELLKHEVAGGFTPEVQAAFRAQPDLVYQVIDDLLSAHFPETLHDDILMAVGISAPMLTASRRSRDPDFRERILSVYHYACAVCGFDVRIDNRVIALEACHIQWHQANGPDTTDNGLALCSMHHKLFDRGAFTLTPELAVQVSPRVHGTGADAWLHAFAGKAIRPPSVYTYRPRQQHLTWHLREVYKAYG